MKDINEITTIENVYLGYTYKGELKILYGKIEIKKNYPFPPRLFIEYKTNKHHTGIPLAPYSKYMGYGGKIWGNDKERVHQMIIDRQKERIDELEKSKALEYAKKIISESGV